MREAVADYHLRRLGLDRTAGDILVGPGSKELIFLLIIAYYGELLVPTPAWNYYGKQAEILERPVHRLATSSDSNWRLTPSALDGACQYDSEKPRILILYYPSIVTGSSYCAGELADLAKVARKYGLIVLADETLGELHYGTEHISIARFYPEGTIVSGGPGKWYGAEGWRLGTFSFPAELRWLEEAMANIASETYTPVSSSIQSAAARAFVGSTEIDSHLARCRRILASLRSFAVECFSEAGLTVSSSGGGLCLFCDFTPLEEALHRKGIYTSLHLCKRLLADTGVAILPGSHFERPLEELSARLAYVEFDGARALKAVADVPTDEILNQAFLRTFCFNTVTAIQHVCQWLAVAGRSQ